MKSVLYFYIMNDNKHVLPTNMKTLSQFKAAYQKAKTQIAKGRIMTNAELNLSHADFHEFIKLQSMELLKEAQKPEFNC